MSENESEFGKGIVVCLAKFSEHLGGGHSAYGEQNVLAYSRWIMMNPDEREAKVKQAKEYPNGDTAHFIGDLAAARIGEKVYGSEEATLSHLIEMWMNGASDHMYDLDERAPQPLQELASLVLKIGHGFTGTTWTMEHVEKIRDLWQASCLAVDAMLGVEAEWGQW